MSSRRLVTHFIRTDVVEMGFSSLTLVTGAFLLLRYGVYGQGCTVSSYGALKSASSCSNLVIKNLEVPVGGSIDLELKSGSTVSSSSLLLDTVLKTIGDV